MGLWKNIYVILTTHINIFAANVRKTSRKCRSSVACHPEWKHAWRVKTCMHHLTSIRLGVRISPRSRQVVWVHPGGEFFFSFLVVNSGRGLTTHDWVQSGAKLTLGRNFSCKQVHSKHFGKGYLYFSRTPFLALDLDSICIWRPRQNLYLTGPALNLYLIDWYPNVAVVGLSDPSRKVWFSKIRLESKITEWTWK